MSTVRPSRIRQARAQAQAAPGRAAARERREWGALMAGGGMDTTNDHLLWDVTP